MVILHAQFKRSSLAPISPLPARGMGVPHVPQRSVGVRLNSIHFPAPRLLQSLRGNMIAAWRLQLLFILDELSQPWPRPVLSYGRSPALLVDSCVASQPTFCTGSQQWLSFQCAYGSFLTELNVLSDTTRLQFSIAIAQRTCSLLIGVPGGKQGSLLWIPRS